jgi:flagellar biosynthesis chaperone FliJ
LLRYVIYVYLFYPKFKPLFMDKVQQLLIDLRMRRASIKTMLTNYQMFEETYQEEIDQMLDDLSKLTKTIEFLEEKLKQGGK